MKKSFSHINIKPLNLLAITFAGIIYSVGITMFLSPVDIYDSGISGLSMLLSQITPDFLSLSLFLLVLNIPIFIFGYKRQGATFTVYAIYAVIVYSASAYIINEVLPIDVSVASPFAQNDLLLCAIFGGLLAGVGSGITMRSGGAMDGIEVLALIFAKPFGISVGTFVMAYNLPLYIIAGIIFQKWILPLYSVIAYSAASKAVDFIVEGLDRAKAAMIITDKAKDICEALSDEFKSGITVMNGKGYYSGADKDIVYIVLNRFQITKLRSIVQEIDSKAYISVTDIADVFSASDKE